MIHGQNPCQGVASSPTLLPEADSFSWMVVRPYGVGKLKLAPFLCLTENFKTDFQNTCVWIFTYNTTNNFAKAMIPAHS